MKTRVTIVIGLVACLVAAIWVWRDRETAGQPAGGVHSGEVTAAPARVVPEMPDIRSVAEALKANKTGKKKASLLQIRDALVRLADESGTSFGSCLCQVYDILAEGASDAQADHLAARLSVINFGDQDLLLSMLAAAPPGPLLRNCTGTALGAAYQVDTSEVITYDLGKAYKVAPESSAREAIAVEWVSRTYYTDGFPTAMAVVDSLLSANERKAAVVNLADNMRFALIEGKLVNDAEITALREKARAVGVRELLLDSFPKTTNQP